MLIKNICKIPKNTCSSSDRHGFWRCWWGHDWWCVFQSFHIYIYIYCISWVAPQWCTVRWRLTPWFIFDQPTPMCQSHITMMMLGDRWWFLLNVPRRMLWLFHLCVGPVNCGDGLCVMFCFDIFLWLLEFQISWMAENVYCRCLFKLLCQIILSCFWGWFGENFVGINIIGSLRFGALYIHTNINQ